MSQWPPPYTIRHHPRAKHVRLRIPSKNNLLITLPPGFKLRNIPEVLEKHRNWIEQTQKSLQIQDSSNEQPEHPSQLVLQAIQQNWTVAYHYQPENAHFIRCQAKENVLILSGNTQDSSLVTKALKRWLLKQARQHLLPWLTQISQKMGISFAQATIRHTKTRWGSCSPQKNISLNAKLLFLPTHMVEHVLLHELCHTIHLNHSHKFWDLLEKIDPNCPKLRYEIKKANSFVH